MTQDTPLDLTLTAHSFFQERIHKAASQLNVKLDDNVEFYLVNLLTEFINPQPLSEEFESDILSTPLVLLLKQITEAPDSRKPTMYRRLGDTSLYISGFFQDYFNDKAFDINYFITIGASAYGQAAEMLRGQQKEGFQPSVLKKISSNFVKVVDIVAQASDTPLNPKATDLLNIYDRWNRCGSDRLRSILQENGITPISVPLKIAQ